MTEVPSGSADKEHGTPFFSVIVPMYNVERYIDECLQSVLLQKFRSIELIVIDDGSTDESVANCLALMDQGHEFLLLGQRQAGPNVARNLALQHAMGKYLLFIDADDRLCSSALVLLYEEMIRYPSTDVTSFGYAFFDDETGVSRAGACPPRRLLNSEDIFVEALIGRDFGGVCWNKCYQRGFLNKYNITFIPDKIHGRDLIFSRSVAMHARVWRSLDAVIYESRYRAGSFSRNFGEHNIRSAIEVAHTHIEVFRDAALKRGALPQLNYAIYRHLRYIILLGAFRSNCYSEYKRYFQIIQDSPLWGLPEREVVYRCDRFIDRAMSMLIRLPRFCWAMTRVLKRLNYEPY
jgi:glycosyltransferase involved in cell wall biosynthesis